MENDYDTMTQEALDAKALADREDQQREEELRADLKRMIARHATMTWGVDIVGDDIQVSLVEPTLAPVNAFAYKAISPNDAKLLAATLVVLAEGIEASLGLEDDEDTVSFENILAAVRES